MNLIAALSRLASFERDLGSVYGWLAQVLAHEDAAAAFGRLALQEAGHATMIEHVRRVAIQNGGDPLSLPLDVAELDALTQSAFALRSNPAALTLRGAVSMAMGIERSAAERIHGALISQADPELGALFATLSRDDERHLGQLTALVDLVERRAA